ncbi:TetR/AcrR family transcriptional regulator [Klebsiella pneumoniae subsp. pneumoniae]|nr:TetR/AcrR family transcriptional regulator [Klebsiella pneumoniae subsp. pneumoniae]
MGSRREQGVRRKSPAETAGAPRGDRCRCAKCFAEKGPHGASVADIARGSGPERRSAISHFASKEAIIEAIVSEIVNARVGGDDR